MMNKQTDQQNVDEFGRDANAGNSKLSRRDVLTSLGIAGVALASGSLLHTARADASVTEHVYGPNGAVGTRKQVEQLSSRITWISVEEFESHATKDGNGVIIDWAPAFNQALSSVPGAKVVCKRGSYKISGQILLPQDTAIVGTKKGFTQGPGTAISNGPNRMYVEHDTKFLLDPADMTMPSFVMERNSTIEGVEIFYPGQSVFSTSLNDIVRFPLTIDAKSGCNLINVNFFGAYHFFKGTGERICIDSLFGYSFGTAIQLYKGADVAYLNNIHLNPNVVRPPEALLWLNTGNPDSVGIYIEEFDGVNISNYHSIFYRTSIKMKLNQGGARSVTVSDFWMDVTGVAFDIEANTGAGVRINNGIVYTGYSNDPTYGGLLRLNNPVKSLITPCLVTNVTVLLVNLSKHPTLTRPDYGITFVSNSNNKLLLSNLDMFGVTKGLMNDTGFNQVDGKIFSGASNFNKSVPSPKRNVLKNSYNFAKGISSDGVPLYWSKDGGTMTVDYLLNGNVKLTTIDSFPTNKGIWQSSILTEPGTYRVVVKAVNPNPRAGLLVRKWNVAHTNAVESSRAFDQDGVARLDLTGVLANESVDVMIHPGQTAGDAIEVEYALLVKGTVWYDYKPIPSGLPPQQEFTLQGDTAPVFAPHYVGEQYIDTAAKTLYQAIGTISSAEWKRVGGSVGLNATLSPTDGPAHTYGAAMTLEPTAGFSGIELYKVKVEWDGAFGAGQTDTVKIRCDYSDSTNAIVEKSASTVTSLWITDDEVVSLIRNGAFITSISVCSKSSSPDSISKKVQLVGYSR